MPEDKPETRNQEPETDYEPSQEELCAQSNHTPYPDDKSPTCLCGKEKYLHDGKALILLKGDFSFQRRVLDAGMIIHFDDRCVKKIGLKYYSNSQQNQVWLPTELIEENRDPYKIALPINSV